MFGCKKCIICFIYERKKDRIGHLTSSVIFEIVDMPFSVKIDWVTIKDAVIFLRRVVFFQLSFKI